MVVLIVLSELGIDIAPLLAGAGVVGLAIGFGAQTLVKDVITGFFILAEDVVSIGDVVDIDGRSGVVEAMSIRSIRLRDATGAVYTIPFSAVTTVKNLTKDFSYATFDVRVAFAESVDRVISVLREVAAGMQEDPAYKHQIRSSLEVWGLDRFGDFAMIVKARIMTAPGSQWTVGREFNKRMKLAFDERGIAIPTSTTVLALPVKAG
jgi:small conductance mechanosensitive channel